MDLDTQLEKNGKVQITADVSAAKVNAAKLTALKNLAQYVSAPGFRQGKAPTAVVEQNIKIDKLVEETFNILATEAYSTALEKDTFAPITRPQVSIPDLDNRGENGIDQFWQKSIKEGSQIKITSYTLPDIDLTNWQKHLKEIPTDSDPVEIETATSIEDAKEKASNKTQASTRTPDAADSAKREQEEKILLSLTESITFAVPDELIQGETEQLLFQQIATVQRLGIGYEDYLKTQGKDPQAIEAELRQTAEKQLRIRFLISGLAKKHSDLFSEDATAQEVVNFIMDEYNQKFPSPKS